MITVNRTSITPGQIGQACDLASQVARTAMNIALTQMEADGEISREGAQEFLKKGDAFKITLIPVFKGAIKSLSVAVGKIATWLRVNVGGVSKEELISNLNNVPAGDTGLTFHISDYAKDITSKPECVVSAAGEAEFAIAAPSDLGFKTNPTTGEFFDQVNLAKYGVK